MSLIHGRAISSQEIEDMVSRHRRFDPREFASLCNAVAWASAGRNCTSLPSFTERVNVKDGGIDAEWQTNLPDGPTYHSSLLGPGWNVFQYKKRDIFAQGREKTFASLRAGLKGEVNNLYHRTGRRPDRYVLFTNVDLTHETEAEGAARPQKKELKKAILEGYDESDSLHIEIVGAAELASLLNDLPHLRAAYFAPANYKTWQRFSLDHTKKKSALFGKRVELIGREQELVKLRSMLDDARIRAVVLSGAHNIGKTRLAIEATAHRPNETVVALDPRSMTASELLSLESPATETIVIIEDPDPEASQTFVDQVLATGALKLLITLPTAEDAPAPNFGRDDRVQLVRVNPLANSQAQSLLRATGVKWNYNTESWVLQQAGGNPGILLLACNLGGELRHTVASFTEDVAEAFERRIRGKLGNRGLEELKLLSLLTHIGFRGKPDQELKTVCSLFAPTLQPHVIMNDLRRLENAGVVRLGGSYAEVVPPLFANWLASSMLRQHPLELLALFARLSQPARLRLLRRLRSLPQEDVGIFWEEMFGESGLFKDLSSALASPYMLRLVAGTVPKNVSRLLETSIRSMSIEDRLSMTGTKRRELVWTLEELLFHRETSKTALRCLALLAEAETEDYGNNATGIFCACFRPSHPQLPLPLQERLELLEEILDPQQPIQLQKVGVKAIEVGLRRMGFGMPLHHSKGPKPLDPPTPVTNGEVWDYLERLGDLLMLAAQSDKPELAQCAVDILPQTIAEVTIQARPRAGAAKFQVLAGWVLSNEVSVSVAKLATGLRLACDALSTRIDRFAGEADTKVLQQCVDEIGALIQQLDRADFSIRLRRWAGERTGDDHEYETDDDGHRIYRVDRELRTLAKEVVDTPEALTDDLLAWLQSSRAKKAYIFFWHLGEEDIERRWLPVIEIRAVELGGVGSFVSYFGSLAKIEESFARERLDELVRAGDVRPEAIVGATRYLHGNLKDVKRVEKLIQDRGVDPVRVEQALSSGWIDSLSDGEYLRFLKVVAGPDLEYAAAAIDSLGMWLGKEKNLQGELSEFAWQCLESAPAIMADHHEYDFDRLAATLVPADPSRGFRLLENLLRSPYSSKSWNPFGLYSNDMFWRALCEVDRSRASRIVLTIALDDSLQQWGLRWDVYALINKELDTDLLIEYALEKDEHAQLVCESISTKRPDFWLVALSIIEKYPNNERIESALARGVEQIRGGEFISGPYSLHLKACREEVKHVLDDPETPTIARPWLERLESSLQVRAERELVTEIDEEVNDLRMFVEDPESPARLWAVETLIRLDKVDYVRKLFTTREVLALLPRLQIEERTRAALRRRLDDRD